MKLDLIVDGVKSSRLLYPIYLLVRDVYSYLGYRKRGSFSQHGEDAFLDRYFGQVSKGFYVDIGCSHPFRISNTYALYKRGWSGIAVDAIHNFGWLYRLWRPRDQFLNLGVGSDRSRMTYFEMTPSVLSSFDKTWVDGLVQRGEATVYRTYDVEVMPLNAILQRYAAGRAIDFLTVDVEGLDLQILSSLDFDKYRPQVICVEFNDEDSRVRTKDLLTARGYDCANVVGCNIMAIDTSHS